MYNGETVPTCSQQILHDKQIMIIFESTNRKISFFKSGWLRAEALA